ncbi:hypothetical protein KGF57_002440 [Candida theae]|uniref:LYC1 C-terminal domain-containing protein n=1 Tax=Candida theae TaxID=1198502 RepID=A0AAD5BF06_9ASCO|nr:uncharacterized protein KGF57_002440 [Candida theae]KAI5958595.1 hypothetical protein KGF57_002440 [Candida theae]
MSPTQIDKAPEQFKLVHVTEQENINFTRYQNSLAWKGALTEDDYVLREYVLSKSKITSSGNNKLYVFMLKSTFDNEPLCSIEMLVRDSLKFEYDNDGARVRKSSVLSGCIGGVFTYPQKRGKGYARIMVDKLVQVAKQDIVGPDGFTFLYSEIGEYYAKNGFKSFPVDLIDISLRNVSQVEPPQVEYELIEYHQFQELMDQYKIYFEQDVIAKVEQDHKSRVSINPTSDLVDWFHLRAKFITYKLFHEQQGHVVDFKKEYDTIKDSLVHEPKVFGLQLKQNGQVTGFIIWTIDWSSETAQDNYATILKVVAFDNQDQTVVDLIQLAIHHFVHYPVLGKPTTNVKLWESEINDAVKRHLVERWSAETGIDNSSRSAILMNNPIDEERLMKGELVWEENTKLPWF